MCPIQREPGRPAWPARRNLHTNYTPVSISPATKTPVVNGTGDAASRCRSRGGRTIMPVLLIAEADLPEEAYAETADKRTA